MNRIQVEEYNILKYFDYFAKQNSIDYVLYGGTLLGSIRHEGFIPWDDDIDVALLRSEYDKFEEKLIATNLDELDYFYQSRITYSYLASSIGKLRSNKLKVKSRVSTTQDGYSGIWVDIFPMDNVPDDERLRKKQYRRVNAYNKIISLFLLTKANPEDVGMRRIIKKAIQSINERFYKKYFFLNYFFRKRDKWMKMYNDIETKYVGCISYMYHKDYEEYSRIIMDRKHFENLTLGKFSDGFYPIPLEYDEVLKSMYGDYMTIPDEKDRITHNIEVID